MDKTFIIFKPDCMANNLVGQVLTRFENAGFSLAAAKMIQLTPEKLREHYAHVADKPFFPDIEKFMGSRPVLVAILKGADAVAKVRDLLGPTDSTKAPAGTIRGDFGETMMVNILHASDSDGNAQIEIDRFFAPSEVLG
ncbi:MAG: nucleoside-diphosphate kinase [Verrucomicrobiia bacterium]|tara:strand:+ start:11746 stop:12162 length:417 start_codon:yes stop_codon:yes gene_type:complete